MGITRLKYIATAKITDPVAVQAYCASKPGWKYYDGAILVNILEQGFKGSKYIYCRYGMSVPYIRVEVDSRVWVEPTIIDNGCMERFIYTGFVDCGNSDNSPSLLDMLKMFFGIDGKVSINLNDKVKLDMDSSASEFKLTVNSNKIEITSSGIKISDSNSNVIETKSSGIKISDSNSNVIETKSSGMTLDTSSGNKVDMQGGNHTVEK